jgi:hypothetical protein
VKFTETFIQTLDGSEEPRLSTSEPVTIEQVIYQSRILSLANLSRTSIFDIVPMRMKLGGTMTRSALGSKVIVMEWKVDVDEPR